jgi:hypothetical protein
MVGADCRMKAVACRERADRCWPQLRADYLRSATMWEALAEEFDRIDNAPRLRPWGPLVIGTSEPR